MSELNFYWRMGDYALQAVPKCLARFSKDDKNGPGNTSVPRQTNKPQTKNTNSILNGLSDDI